MRFFSTCEARKTRTLRGRIGTSSPVLGLRPIRSPFSRTEKLPKDDSFTIEMKINVRVPESNATLEELAALNADLPKVLPALPAMVETGKVSGFYHQLYKVKT